MTIQDDFIQAVKDNRYQGIPSLVAKGANPNLLMNPPGVYPLYIACVRESIGMVQVLLYVGAKTDIFLGGTLTPLYVATARPNNQDMVRLLIDRSSPRTIIYTFNKFSEEKDIEAMKLIASIIGNTENLTIILDMAFKKGYNIRVNSMNPYYSSKYEDNETIYREIDSRYTKSAEYLEKFFNENTGKYLTLPHEIEILGKGREIIFINIKLTLEKEARVEQANKGTEAEKESSVLKIGEFFEEKPAKKIVRFKLSESHSIKEAGIENPLLKIENLAEDNSAGEKAFLSGDKMFYGGLAFERMVINPGIRLISDQISGKNSDKPVIDHWTEQYSLESLKELGAGLAVGAAVSYAGASPLNVFIASKMAADLAHNQFSFEFLSPEYAKSVLISSATNLISFCAVHMSGVYHNNNQFMAGVKVGAISSVVAAAVDIAGNMLGADVSTVDQEL